MSVLPGRYKFHDVTVRLVGPFFEYLKMSYFDFIQEFIIRVFKYLVDRVNIISSKNEVVDLGFIFIANYVPVHTLKII